MTGQILGTPSYMPPEQASGYRHDVGPGDDIYALGAQVTIALAGVALAYQVWRMNVLREYYGERI